jgi:uncharacterized protein (DUF362 family)
MKPRVAIVKVKEEIEDAVKEALHLLGGIDQYVEADGTYLIKPNLFTVKTWDTGATTDPRIFMTLAEMLKEIGATPVVGECPASASYAQPDIVFDGLGIRELCQKAGVDIKVLDREEPIRVEIPAGEVVSSLWFPKFALECDGIFNMPKLKTHVLTSMTCAVKNLFGLQQGGSKAHHHVMAGNQPEKFSRLLIDLYEAIRERVRLTVVDADIAMEGEGPTTGDPVKLGVIIAGDDSAAVDMVAASLMDWNPLEVGTILIASERGLGPESIQDIELLGVPIESLKRRFKMPVIHSGGETFVKMRMPIEVDYEICLGCGICQKVCPSGAITLNEIPKFKDNLCIQCFCCIELCPKGALKVVRTR